MTGSGPAPASPRPLAGWVLWLAFLAVTTGAFMINVDASIVNVILPVLSQRFQVSIAALQWSVSAFLLANTGVIPAATRLSDVVGRRVIFLASLSGFILGSVLCAVAPTYRFLVAARALQGVGAGVLMVNVLAIVVLIFPASQRGRALGMVGAVVAAGTLFGPPIGGFLTSLWGWRSVFWINLPFGLWAFAGGLHLLPHFPPESQLRFKDLDWAGGVAYALFTSLLELALPNVHRWVGWLLLLAAALALAAFIRREADCPHPLIPLKSFRVDGFRRGMLAGMVFWMTMMFPSFLMPLYLQALHNVSEALIGLVMMAQPVATLLSAPLGGWLTDRWGTYVPTQIGFGFCALGDLLLALATGSTPIGFLVAWLAVVGVGAGLFNAPNNAQIVNSVPPAEVGFASGMTAVERTLGRALGVAVVTLLLSVIWTLGGIGPVLPLGAPRYAYWLSVGFRGDFFGACGLSILGMWVVFRGRPGHARAKTAGV